VEIKVPRTFWGHGWSIQRLQSVATLYIHEPPKLRAGFVCTCVKKGCAMHEIVAPPKSAEERLREAEAFARTNEYVKGAEVIRILRGETEPVPEPTLLEAVEAFLCDGNTPEIRAQIRAAARRERAKRSVRCVASGISRRSERIIDMAGERTVGEHVIEFSWVERLASAPCGCLATKEDGPGGRMIIRYKPCNSKPSLLAMEARRDAELRAAEARIRRECAEAAERAVAAEGYGERAPLMKRVRAAILGEGKR
jgi:hypothetical protein